VTPQRPRAITSEDFPTVFNSGEISLDRYLVDKALFNHINGFSRCYVTVDKETNDIIGYYTLSAVSVQRDSLSGKVRRNAPNPVPAILLGRLAVDKSAQGRGLGKFLVRDGILSTLAAANIIGARILLVHTINDHVSSFYSQFGFQKSPTDERQMYLLLDDAKKSLPKQ